MAEESRDVAASLHSQESQTHTPELNSHFKSVSAGAVCVVPSLATFAASSTVFEKLLEKFAKLWWVQ